MLLYLRCAQKQCAVSALFTVSGKTRLLTAALHCQIHAVCVQVPGSVYVHFSVIPNIFGCYRLLHSWDTVCRCCCHIEQANLKSHDPQLLHTDPEPSRYCKHLNQHLNHLFSFTGDTDRELVLLYITEQTSQ